MLLVSILPGEDFDVKLSLTVQLSVSLQDTARACPESGTWPAVSPCRWREPSPLPSCSPAAWRTTSPHSRSWRAPPPRPPAGSPPAPWGPCSRRGPGTGGRWAGGSPSGQPRWSCGRGEDPSSEIWETSLYFLLVLPIILSLPWTISTIRGLKL